MVEKGVKQLRKVIALTATMKSRAYSTNGQKSVFMTSIRKRAVMGNH